jgi:hypothetical protein
MDEDANHLDLLAIFHYVVAGLTGLFALLPMIHVIIGLFLASSQDPASFIGWFFIFIGGTLVTMGLTFAGCIFFAGRCLHQRVNYWFAFVVACIECVFMPFGTVLGELTIIVLSRPSVKTLFGLGPAPPAPA